MKGASGWLRGSARPGYLSTIGVWVTPASIQETLTRHRDVPTFPFRGAGEDWGKGELMEESEGPRVISAPSARVGGIPLTDLRYFRP